MLRLAIKKTTLFGTHSFLLRNNLQPTELQQSNIQYSGFFLYDVIYLGTEQSSLLL